MIISLLTVDDYLQLMKYEQENRAHLCAWEPERGDGYFSIKSTKARLEQGVGDYHAGRSLNLVARDKQGQQIIAKCHFSNIVYGVFQACHLGYSIAASHQGKGLMQEMLTAALDYVFMELGLHRVMANYIPANERSGKLLTQLGFEQEGVAKSYLKIAGKWQDHVLTSRLNPAH